MQRLKLFALGVLLIPLLLATLIHVPSLAQDLSNQWQSWLFIVGGAIGYVLFEAVFNRPMRTYVFGHELTHALACWMMGGQVKSFNVSKNGGHVEVTKNNFFVALAPYCLPLYTWLLVLIFFAARFFLPLQNYHNYFYFLLGCSLAFHFSLTLHALRQDQPDIQSTGLFFSIVFILLLNTWLLIVLAKLVFPQQVQLKNFLMAVLQTQKDIAYWIFLHAKEIAQQLYLAMRS